MISVVTGKFNTYGGVEVTIVKRMWETNHQDFWYCGYVPCRTEVSVSEISSQHGYADEGEVMYLNQPELGLVGWYYFWDTAHAGWTNTERNLISIIVQEVREGNY